jgi:hypothetical protein
LDAILSISIDLQIVLIAGYLGYKVATVGRGIAHSTEEFLVQLLVFGSISRGIAYLIELVAVWLASSTPNTIPPEGRTLAIAVVTLVAGIACGAIWRKSGNRLVSVLMRATGTHVDDHEPTTWASIRATKATWTFIQLHLRDGTTLESVFGQLPSDVPGGPFIVADDGINIYVTKITRPDGTSVDCSVVGMMQDVVATYVPRDNINQVDYGWR